MDEKAKLIQQLDEARAKMRAVLEGIDTRVEIYPTWTIKEVLAHIAGWDDVSASSLRLHAGGHEPPTPAARGIDYYNAESVATRAALSYQQVVQEWELAREEFKAALLALSPEKLAEPFIFPWGPTGTVALLVRIFAEHEEEHAAEIAALKAKAEAEAAGDSKA
jgi:hypothetical protein